jgi:hypothetical protein
MLLIRGHETIETVLSKQKKSNFTLKIPTFQSRKIKESAHFAT